MREAIKEQCDRQRGALLRKEAANAQVVLLEKIVGDLLSQADFVDVLKAAGFPTMPRLVRQRLQRPLTQNCPASGKPDTGSEIVRCQQDKATCASDETSALAGQTLPMRTIRALGRMSPLRRAAVAKLMRAVDDITGDFAHALLAATPENMRTVVVRRQRFDDSRKRSFAKLEKLLTDLQGKNQTLSVAHNANLTYLAVCCSYVRGWAHCYDVLSWLHKRYPLYAASLERITRETDCAKQPKRTMKLPYARDRTADSPKKTGRKPRAHRDNVKTTGS
ncbi:hypothetical protein [Paraburkholderia aspalathi]|uniref:hypothetical protein n=1 Tax=Paraburkholderia aspalathi TaxID=1324617 RepID=UPI0038B6F58D